MRIGVIADTHLPSLIRDLDKLGPQVREFLETVDLILHAGDVIAPSVVHWCEQFAPVKVARGNNDLFEHASLADRHIFDVDGWRIGLVHQVRPESRPVKELFDDGLKGEVVDILIAGDTHVERLEFREDVLFMNPGSPTLPHHKDFRLGSVGLLEIDASKAYGEIVKLGETDGSRNPCTPSTLCLTKDEQGIRVLA